MGKLSPGRAAIRGNVGLGGPEMAFSELHYLMIAAQSSRSCPFSSWASGSWSQPGTIESHADFPHPAVGGRDPMLLGVPDLTHLMSRATLVLRKATGVTTNGGMSATPRVVGAHGTLSAGVAPIRGHKEV